MTELPDGWAQADIEQLVELQANGKPFQQGWSPQCESRPATDEEWGVVKTTAIQHGEFWAHENKALPTKLEPKPAIEILAGDVLMTCAGPRNRCGVACLVTSTRSKLMMSGKMYRFRPHPAILNAHYLSFFLREHSTQLRINEMKTGISDSGLNLTHGRFAKLPMAIPPLNEQRRIVEKIEAAFGEIDAGVESLKAARVKLGLYRQALLKSAFEGRLTADWRAQNPDKLEDPKTLLARIQSERDTRYKTALSDWQAALVQWREDGENGKKPAKPKRQKTETNHSLFEVLNCENFPINWSVVPLVEVVDIISGGTPKGIEECKGSDFPFFKVSDMNTLGNESFLSVSPLSASEEEAKALNLTICPAGTIVFPKRGGAILTNKKRRLKLSGAFDLNTMGFVNSTETIQDDFIWHWVHCFHLSRIYDGSNVPQINNKNVEPLSFPICSPAEQTEITRILDAKLSAADKMEAEIDAALTRAEALRQSILKKAFSGKLVPQDPTDEPASTLLARIQAERAAAKKVKTKAKRKTSV